MVKVRILHSIRRFGFQGKMYLPDDIVDIGDHRVRLDFMVPIPEPVSSTPESVVPEIIVQAPIIESAPQELVVVEKKKRKPKGDAASLV